MKHEFEKFIAVVELGSYTKASEQLHVSQPALSYAINDLEKELGHQLLVRGGGRVTLTEAGKSVYDAAKHMRLELDNLKAILSESDGTEVVRVRLGMIDSIGSLVFEQNLVQNVKRVEVAVHNSQELLQDIGLDRLDIAFITKQFKHDPTEIILRSVGSEPFVMVAHKDIKERIAEQLKNKEITEFLSYNEKSNTYGLINRTLKGSGIKIVPTAFSTDPQLLKNMAMSGRGAALLPFRQVEEQINSGEFVTFNVKFNREIQVAYRSGKYLNTALVNTIEAVKHALKKECEKVEQQNA